MSWFSRLIEKQGHLMLNYEFIALLNVVVLSCLPYMGWLAATMVALVTLRKGWRPGSYLLIAAMASTFVVMRGMGPVAFVLITAMLSFFPGYLAAVVLRETRSWRWVVISLMAQILVVMCLLHALAPDFIVQQYQQLLSMLAQLKVGDSTTALSSLGLANKHVDPVRMANYLVGIQALGLVVSVLLSLMLARAVQSKLFNPGGFRQELRCFRGTKVDVLMLMILLFAAKQQAVLAIDLLPVGLFYFFAMGMSLWFDVITQRGLFSAVGFISLALSFFPHILLYVYVAAGVLDIMFNFRLYLSAKTGKAIREVK